LYRCSCSLCNSQGASRGEDLKRQGRPAEAGRCLGSRGVTTTGVGTHLQNGRENNGTGCERAKRPKPTIRSNELDDE